MTQLSLFDSPSAPTEGSWYEGRTFEYQGKLWTVTQVGRQYMIIDSAGQVDAWIVAEHRLVSERNRDRYQQP